MFRSFFALAFCSLATPSLSDANVLADIKPIHSLAAMVTEGITSPKVLVNNNASLHHVALKPSQARIVGKADVIFWIGPELFPWMEKAIASLASSAHTIALIDTHNTQTYELRESHSDHGDEHGHDDHAIDPHAWLDPQNARHWVSEMARSLAKQDPQNAARYEANAQTADKRLAELEQKIETILAPNRETPILATHDAFQYLEKRFGLKLGGVLANAADTGLNAKTMSQLKKDIQKHDRLCVLSDTPQNTQIKTSFELPNHTKTAFLDLVGHTQEMGPDLYENTMIKLATDIAQCLE